MKSSDDGLDAFAGELHGDDVVTPRWSSEMLCRSGALWSVPEVLRLWRLNSFPERSSAPGYWQSPVVLSQVPSRQEYTQGSPPSGSVKRQRSPRRGSRAQVPPSSTPFVQMR